VERLLAHRFGFNRPSWVSASYWSNIVTPSMPPPQECFINTDCPSTACISSYCGNGTCIQDIHVNQTCDYGDLCTTGDKCANTGVCVGVPITCTGLAICVGGTCQNPQPPSLPTCTYTNTFGNFHLYWNWINEDPPSIRLAFSLPGSAFIGLGFGSSMNAADIILGWVNTDGTFSVGDRYAYSPSTPGLDTSYGGSYDLSDVWATRSNGVTTIWVTRRLNTTDVFDSVITKNAITSFIFAWNNGNPGTVTYHGNNKLAVNVDMRGC